jgi:hypothetical protein
MSRAIHRRLRRLERAPEPEGERVKYVYSVLPLNPDGSRPTEEEEEAALNAPPMTEEEWAAEYCRDPEG